MLVQPVYRFRLPRKNTPLEKRKTVKYMEAGLYPREMAVCYATSEDGLRWTKPELGIYEFKGSSANNITYRLPADTDEAGVHGAGVFKDCHETDASRRYKMFFTNCQQNMSAAFLF